MRLDRFLPWASAIVAVIAILTPKESYGINLVVTEDSLTRLEFTLDWNIIGYADYHSPTTFIDIEDHPSDPVRLIAIGAQLANFEGVAKADSIFVSLGLIGLNFNGLPFQYEDRLPAAQSYFPDPIYSRITFDAPAGFGHFIYSTAPVPDYEATWISFGLALSALTFFRFVPIRRGKPKPTM